MVDDDEAIRAMLKVTLEHAGFHVICAPNSKDIVSLQRTHKPALIIMDLMMPEHEGMEGIFSLVGASTVPIIAISSSGNFLQIVEKLVAQTLTKPFSSDTLLQNVRKILSKGSVT